jgi:hypothetical protein
MKKTPSFSIVSLAYFLKSSVHLLSLSENDGVFFMPLADFKKAFTIYNIAQYSNYANYSTASIKGKGKKFYKRFTSSAD